MQLGGRRIEGLLLDMDGVLCVSWEPVPGAVEAFARLRHAGLPICVISNTTSRTRAAFAAQLRAVGFEIEDHEVLTAAVAAAAYLREQYPGAAVAMIGDAQREDLDGVRLVALADSPDVVLISGADESFTFSALNTVLRRLLDGAAFVAMHRNLDWMTKDGPCLDAGSYLIGLERAAGREAVITGKPASQCFRAGLELLGLHADVVAMVGDDVENDVLAAQALGIGGVLVRTGKFREERPRRCVGPPGRAHRLVRRSAGSARRVARTGPRCHKPGRRLAGQSRSAGLIALVLAMSASVAWHDGRGMAAACRG